MLTQKQKARIINSEELKSKSKSVSPVNSRRFHVLDLDVWGNKKDGYSVNGGTSIGIIWLPEFASSEQIVRALKIGKFLKKGCHTKSLEISGDDEFKSITDIRNGDFYPLYNLQLDYSNR